MSRQAAALNDHIENSVQDEIERDEDTPKVIKFNFTH